MTAACAACAAVPAPQTLVPPAAAQVTLMVPDIHCPACIQAIEQALLAVAGVRAARVNLSLRRVEVATDLAPVELVDTLAAAGYAAYPFDPAALDGHRDRVARDMVFRVGVAGFAMMNVMLLSVAVWSGAPDATRDLFHLISATIALPATVYAAQPFFRNAMEALSAWRLNMDVPISLAIILAGGMSLYETLNGGAHAYFDAALSLTFFLLIGRVLEHRSRAVARSAARDLAAMEVQNAIRTRGGVLETVPVADLRVGDRVVIHTGMRVPVDGRLTGSVAFCDRSFLTGESEPVSHGTGAELKAGEINVGPPFEMRTEAVGEDTALRKIAALVETAENARNRYTSLADRAARIYAPAVHLLAAITFLGWLGAVGDIRHALNAAIAVLIITCPCALGLAVPAVSTAAIGKLYERGFLVKSGTALERLAQVGTLIFDKTGTLTRPGFAIDTLDLTPSEMRIAKALCQSSSHPLSLALSRDLGAVDPAEVSDITEHAGCGISGVFAGQDVRLGNGVWAGGAAADLTLRIGEKIIPLPHAETSVPGAIAVQDRLQCMGYDRRIISGDRAVRTGQVAARLGIAEWAADMSPQEKHAYVTDANADGPVCMIGDGINDAAAMAAAHASVAPSTALDASRNAADVVVIRDTLVDLPTLFAVSRKTVRLSQQNFAIAAVYNCVSIPIAMAGLATPLLAALAMSLSSITVILNALRVRRVK